MQDESPDRRASPDPGGDPPVTVLVTRRVKPGKEAEYEKFVSGVAAAASAFPGHLGATVFRPEGHDDREYRVVMRFDHESSLKRWEDSAERKAWHARARELAEDLPAAQKVTGLETWFTLPGRRTITPPPRYKMALITWAAVYPLVTLIFFLLQPLFLQMPTPLRTLVLTGIMIPAMTYVIMPGMARLFKRWLYPAGDGSETDHDVSGRGPAGHGDR